jgi:hypothetical protein
MQDGTDSHDLLRSNMIECIVYLDCEMKTYKGVEHLGSIVSQYLVPDLEV